MEYSKPWENCDLQEKVKRVLVEANAFQDSVKRHLDRAREAQSEADRYRVHAARIQAGELGRTI